MITVDSLIQSLRMEADSAGEIVQMMPQIQGSEGFAVLGRKMRAAADVLESQEQTIAQLIHERDGWRERALRAEGKAP